MDQQSATPQAGGVEVTIILLQCCVLLGKHPIGTILTIGKGGEAKSPLTRPGKERPSIVEALDGKPS